MRSLARFAFLFSLATSITATAAFAQKTKGVSRQPQALNKPGWKEQQAMYNHILMNAQNRFGSNVFISGYNLGDHSNSRKTQQVYVTVAEQPIFWAQGASASSTGTAPTRAEQLSLVRSAHSPASTSIMPPWIPPQFEKTWSATFTIRREAGSKKAGLVPGKLKSVTNSTDWQENFWSPPILPMNAAPASSSP